VRPVIRHESIITAMIRATLGIGLGLFLAATTTAALSQYGIVVAVPVGTRAVVVAVAILTGLLAAILPARRASCLNVLAAVPYE
jgi:putative ABC transport system permease protein